MSYGHLAVEGQVAVLRVRFFRDDLEETLAHFAKEDGFRLQADPVVDALFMSYFSERFSLSAGDSKVPGRVIGSGEDEVDREPVWWYLVQFDAPVPLTSMRIRNSLLLDVFPDQKNVLKAVHFPDETQMTVYFAAGEEEVEVRFR